MLINNTEPLLLMVSSDNRRHSFCVIRRISSIYAQYIKYVEYGFLPLSMSTLLSFPSIPIQVIRISTKIMKAIKYRNDYNEKLCQTSL